MKGIENSLSSLGCFLARESTSIYVYLPTHDIASETSWAESTWSPPYVLSEIWSYGPTWFNILLIQAVKSWGPLNITCIGWFYTHLNEIHHWIVLQKNIKNTNQRKKKKKDEIRYLKTKYAWKQMQRLTLNFMYR